MVETSKFVEDVIAKHGNLLIPALQDIQEYYKYLPEIDRNLDFPLNEI